MFLLDEADEDGWMDVPVFLAAFHCKRSPPMGGSKGLYQADIHWQLVLSLFFYLAFLLIMFQFSVCPLKLSSHSSNMEAD